MEITMKKKDLLPNIKKVIFEEMELWGSTLNEEQVEELAMKIIINIIDFDTYKKITKMELKLNGVELNYLINIMTKDIYKMQDNNVSFENGFIDKLHSKLIVLTKK